MTDPEMLDLAVRHLEAARSCAALLPAARACNEAATCLEYAGLTGEAGRARELYRKLFYGRGDARAKLDALCADLGRMT